MSVMEIVTTSERPELRKSAGMAALRDAWPQFARHDPLSNLHRPAVRRYFPEFDVLLVEDDEVLAVAGAVALRWDGDPATLPTGYDGAIVTAVAEHENAVEPDTLCIMAATVHPERTGGGLAGTVLSALCDRAVAAGLHRVVVPVRPPLKARYPLTSMADFATWTRPDGLHLDHWIRTHQRLGATILGPAERSMVIPGTVAQWEEWTGMAFPQTGHYVVPGALATVEVDREQDLGTYVEPNLWMRHR